MPARRDHEMKRIQVTAKLMEAAPAGVFTGCLRCGDDIEVHDWIEIDDVGNIVNCDRS
jgi:hypothetical protein